MSTTSSIADDVIDARLALMGAHNVMTADDVECDDGPLFNHRRSVSFAYEMTNGVALMPARFAGDTLPAGLVRWFTEGQEEAARLAKEKADLKTKRKNDKRARDNERAANQPPGELIEISTTQRQVKQLRLERILHDIDEKNARILRRMHAFEFAGGWMADRHYESIHESFGFKKYRSHQHPNFARFLQLLPTVSRSATGDDKTSITYHTRHDSALLTRDAAYIVLDPSRYGVLVVELDSTWLTYASLIAALRAILPKKLMPTIIVSRASVCGKFEVERPHLLWTLPNEVGLTGRSGSAPIKFFRKVRLALVSALIQIGADPNHHNHQKCKNPLSPFWNVLALNTEWPSLEDFRGRGGIDLNVNLHEMKQRAALYRATQPGESVSLSNEIWIAAKDMIKAALATARVTQDKDFLATTNDPVRRSRWLHRQVHGPMMDKFQDSADQVTKLVNEHCEYWSKQRDLKQVERGRDRWRNAKDGCETARERQQNAASLTNKGQRTNSLKVVTAAILVLMKAGLEPDPVYVVRHCAETKGPAQSTVYKYYDAALLIADQEFRDGARYIAMHHLDNIQRPAFLSVSPSGAVISVASSKIAGSTPTYQAKTRPLWPSNRPPDQPGSKFSAFRASGIVKRFVSSSRQRAAVANRDPDLAIRIAS